VSKGKGEMDNWGQQLPTPSKAENLLSSTFGWSVGYGDGKVRSLVKSGTGGKGEVTGQRGTGVEYELRTR